MDYNTFEKYIKGLQEEWDWMDECCKIGFEAFEHSNGLTYSICLLEEIFDDKDKWLSWWAFEKDFGRDEKYNAYNKDNNIIPTTTIEDIYNLLMENMDAIS